MYYGGWGWRPYVSVAHRQAQAMRKIAQLKKKGHVVSPVEIEGRGIATTFWGKAWCENLERYSDYANRLPRGRTYVRNGSVIDLQIAFGEVKALVSGSAIYKVAVKITPVSMARWKSICKADFPRESWSEFAEKTMDCSPRQGRFNFRAVAQTGLICASMSPPCSTASAHASTASPSSCFGFTSWTKRNSSAAPVESFLSQRKDEIPVKFCLPAICLNSLDWISLKAAHPHPHCLQLAQVRTRVRRKCEGASTLSVPAGDSARHKPPADVFSLFSLPNAQSSWLRKVLAGTTTGRWTRKQSVG